MRTLNLTKALWVLPIIVFIKMLLCLKVVAQDGMNPDYSFLTNAPPQGFSSRIEYLKSFTNGQDIYNAYHSGIMNKEEAVLATEYLEGRKSMDFYGKVVDQNGTPVADVSVQGNIELAGDFYPHFTQTDPNGEFNFTNVQGASLSIMLKKPGYDYNVRRYAERPHGYVPDPQNPIVFVVWKLHGKQNIIHQKFLVRLLCDGTPVRFDLVSGKESDDGDLIVKFTRNPLNLSRTRLFNWSVDLQMPNGGLQEITNIYPFEAPADNYQSNVDLNFQTNMPGWTSQLQRHYYFKSNDQKIYGRMTMDIYGFFQPPPVPIVLDVYVNSSGSRNLEYDKKVWAMSPIKVGVPLPP
jgi:hypothetical protein